MESICKKLRKIAIAEIKAAAKELKALAEPVLAAHGYTGGEIHLDLEEAPLCSCHVSWEREVSGLSLEIYYDLVAEAEGRRPIVLWLTQGNDWGLERRLHAKYAHNIPAQIEKLLTSKLQPL